MLNKPYDIAIIGMACRFPEANSLKQFWDNILNGVNSTTYFSDIDLRNEGISETDLVKPTYIKAKPYLDGADCFDASFFGFSQKEAKFLDPQIRIFLETAFHALEDASYNPDICPHNVGVFAGASTSLEWNKIVLQNLQGLTTSESFDSLILSCKDFLSQIVSYRLNLTGPSYTIYTACSTALAAVHLACQSILMGDCSMAIAGGVTIDLPFRGGYNYEPGLVRSEKGVCRPFDNSADGTIFGDGAGAIVLKKLEEAITDKNQIYAIIRGSQCNNDGHRKSGFVAPSFEGQKDVLVAAHQISQTPFDSVKYIETHGTGTRVGDPIEFEGIKQSHSERKTECALGSVKANIGHLHAAAGIASLIKTALALKNKTIPPLIHFEKLNTEVFDSGSFIFPKQSSYWNQQTKNPRRAGVSSFGVGGTNAHLIVEEHLSNNDSNDSVGGSFLLPFSAKTHEALAQKISQFSNFIKKEDRPNLASLSFTMQLGREAFSFRKAIIAENCESLLSQLDKPAFSSIKATGNTMILCFPEVIEIPSTQNNVDELTSSYDWGGTFKNILQDNLSINLVHLSSKENLSVTEQRIISFIHQLEFVNCLFRNGLQPQSIFGLGAKNAIIAAICSRPKSHIENLLSDYVKLIKIGDEFEKEAGNLNLCLVRLDELKSLSPIQLSQSCFLFWGENSSNLKEISFLKGQTRFIIDNLDKENNPIATRTLLGKLWEFGITLDWQIFNGKAKLPFVALPPYPFEKQKHWFQDKVKANILPLEEIVRSICQESIDVEPIRNDDNLFRLGADSLQLIQIASRIHHDYGIDIPIEEFSRDPKISFLLQLLKEAQVS